MPASQLVLTGVPAFVGAVLGPTRVRFFIDENEFDPKNGIEVDLAKHTLAVAAAAWGTDVDCDHQTKGGFTTIGPRFHKDAVAHVGAVYLAERLVTQYASVLAKWPPTPDELYQYQLVIRSGNGQPARYHGFKVRVESPAQGTLAHVTFLRTSDPATPGTQAPFGPPQWIDLADADVCDPRANGFTTIDPSSPPGTTGALFVSPRVIAYDTPTGPKVPKYLGW